VQLARTANSLPKPLDRPGVPLTRSVDGSISGIEAAMRGESTQNKTLFSDVRADDRIPSNHPLRLIRQIADAALAELSESIRICGVSA
jgi:hypothetical protein